MTYPNASTVDEKPEAVRPPRSDHILQVFVGHANDHHIELSITLQVGGVLVSGTLIGISRYFELLSEQIRSANGSKVLAEAIADGFAQVAKSMDEEAVVVSEKETESESVERAPLPNFIHLRDVRFSGPSLDSSGVNRNLLWRGGVAAVDGWFLGQSS